MIISRIEREAVHDAHLTIGSLTFPRDIPALCYQLGEALVVVRSPSVSDVDESLAHLEASADGLSGARERIREADDDLRGRWSGEAADTGRIALAELDGELEAMARSIRDEIAVAAADLRKTAAAASATVDAARLRMMRAFSLTPQLRSHLEGEARTARFAALFSLIKTEAREGLSRVIDAYQDFDQASYRFIDTAHRAERAIHPDRHAQTGGFIA